MLDIALLSSCSLLVLTLHGCETKSETWLLAWGISWVTEYVAKGMRSSRYWQVEKRGLQFVVYRADNGNPVCQAIKEKKSIAMTSLTLMLEESVYKGPVEVKGNTGLFFNFKML
ncbi:hypothetical protein BTVI_90168 [Pitangus sulphuratus]|nr:hypothetical protein BTVI_90168 [Pitangus sulphuratus]